VPDTVQEQDLLANRIRRLEMERDSIQQIGKALSSELNLDRLLILVMDEVNRLMNSERGTFYIVDEERGELWSRIAQQAEITEIRLKIGTGIAGYVAKTGETINIKDAYNDDRFDPSVDKKTGYKTRSMLCMPIFESAKEEQSKKRIIGVLQILNKRDGVFTEDDEELLASIGSQVAITVNNSRLYTRLEKKVEEQELLFAIEQESTKAYTLDELLTILIKEISKTLKIEAALISLRDKSTNDFVYRVAENISFETINENKANVDRGVVGNIEQSGQLYFSNDAESDPLFNKEFAKQIGITVRQFASAPLKIGDDVIGILEVFNKAEKNEFFREEDIRLIQSLASQISRIIENVQLRDEKIKADRLATIGNMMSTIVHDLRTPINNIYGFVDLMQEEEEQELRAEYADIVNQQIKNLNNMTTDILQFAKGKTTILPVKYAADKIIKDFARLYESDIKKRGFNFVYECNVSEMIYIDPEKVTRIFMNIMKNALEAMEPGGTFSLIANSAGDEVAFLLSDTGKGIPAEIRDRLFDSFVTSGKKDGTGLGLAIVKKFIDQHKGRIEVDSEPGAGTTFKIYFKVLH
jgi:signal transduction histidine kinase